MSLLDSQDGSGLGRALVDGRSVMVLTAPGTSAARTATVDGLTFSDLPELLAACDGRADRVEAGAEVVLDDLSLVSPIENPRKIICVGQNYAAHVAEGGRTSSPAYPDLFAKWANALSGPHAEVPLPEESDQIDFESELAVVIGRKCRRVSAAEVADVVFGYTAANDGSVRDFQVHTAQRTAGKAWERLTPLGPVVIPAQRLGGVNPDLQITGLFNGRIVQDDRTSSMLFSVSDLVQYITIFMSLEPGDVILTGTPAGVGAVREPRLFLRDGDTFEVRIEGIGACKNTYVKEQRQ